MIKPHNPNSEFELGGINHVALVCSDMARTVDFYSNVLGMPLIKSLDLPGGVGQHFFFDAGNGDCVAFFWFADAPDRVPTASDSKTRACGSAQCSTTMRVSGRSRPPCIPGSTCDRSTFRIRTGLPSSSLAG
jgi:hypothetical protein